MTSDTTPPAPLAVEALPVVAYRVFSDFGGWHTYPNVFAPEGRHMENQELTPHADAEAQLSTLRAEIYRLQYEQDVWGDELPKSQACEAVLRDQVARLERERDDLRIEVVAGDKVIDELNDELDAVKAAPTRPIRTHGALPPPGAQTTPLPPFGPHPATQMRGGAPIDVERVMELAQAFANTHAMAFYADPELEPDSDEIVGRMRFCDAAREALRSALAGDGK